MAQHQAQVLLRDGCHGLLHCCRGLQDLVCDIVHLLTGQLRVDTTCKQVGKVLQPLQGVCLQGQQRGSSGVGSAGQQCRKAVICGLPASVAFTRYSGTNFRPHEARCSTPCGVWQQQQEQCSALMVPNQATHLDLGP